MDKINLYDNQNLDSYSDGEGEEDDECQPVTLETVDSFQMENYCLCIKNVPKKMEERELQHLILEHGKINNLHKGNNGPYWFINCKSQSDMESILKGMERNRFGMKVEIKKEKKKEINHISYDSVRFPIHNLNDNDNNRGVDLTNRKLKFFVENPVPNIKYSFENLGGSLNSSAAIGRTDSTAKTRDLMLKRFTKEANDSVRVHDSKKDVYEKLSIEFNSMSVGTCMVCGIVCSKFCDERCNVHYCSVKCQTKHWKQFDSLKTPSIDEPQKENCKSDNKLSLQLNHNDKHQNKKLNSVMSNINNGKENNNVNFLKSTPRIDPSPSSSKVIMLFAYCSNRFVVRSADSNHSEEYLNILNEIAGSFEMAKELSSLPKLYSYCITEYDGIYCRAIVDKVISKSEIHVIYVDFGNAEVKKLSELKELLPELHELTRYPFEVRLRSLENLTTIGNEQFKMLTTELIDNSVQMKLIYDDNNKNGYVISNAVLIKIQTNESINNMMLNILSFGIPNDYEPIMKTEVIYKEIEIYSNMKLIVFDVEFIEDGTLVCIPEDLYPHLKLFEDQLKKYATSCTKAICPRPNEMCVAEYKGVWRRAVCYEVVGDGNPTLEFIDYGDICPINIKKIRKYPKNSTFPCWTHIYTITEVKNMVNSITDSKKRESVVNLLKELIKLHEIITPVEISKMDDSSYSIKLPYVTDKMRSN